MQRELGQDEFTRQVRYAYDRGIRFFETAESYHEMHNMLGIALKGIPRDSYRIMSKVTTRDGVNPQEKLDELRKLANADYFDIMLMHYQHVATWPEGLYNGCVVRVNYSYERSHYSFAGSTGEKHHLAHEKRHLRDE